MSAFRYAAAILFGLTTLPVWGDDSHTGDAAWITIRHADGLTVQIPAPVTSRLLENVRQLRTRLLDEQVVLGELVEETSFDVTDTLISVILPGGLIYASYRKLSNDRAQAQLASVNKELSDLSKGLLLLKAESGETAVAVLR